jgi:hypothetical protein
VHAIGELDHHDRALARGAHESTGYRSRPSPELAKYDLHMMTLAMAGGTCIPFPEPPILFCLSPVFLCFSAPASVCSAAGALSGRVGW